MTGGNVLGKPLEFWVALAAGALIVIERNRARPFVGRVFIAAISAGIGYSQTPEVALWTGRSETLVVMVLTAFGYMLLDIVAAVLADREFVKSIIRERLGK
ncbi:hypothetical protein [Salipiger bermudensis]|uniref:Uncharacterized protein n=1 Tax=Salipiger bermudensis (strain DSM 26914 / JCM 13377 / KCTC 12554 / HTCC2601) TaxID=314265 RepID=Q0FLN7_SALBH|nr:hypothetical protein [Salipiger bermudensis]EAU45061.1 hypothetical protein R2601_22781 [Salipiger bermudensis HTCC2601]